MMECPRSCKTRSPRGLGFAVMAIRILMDCAPPTLTSFVDPTELNLNVFVPVMSVKPATGRPPRHAQEEERLPY